MKRILGAGALITLATSVAASPVDMTGLACSHPTNLGSLTWEFYGDTAIRYFQDGSVSSLPRVGNGAYERYDREGEWAAVYLFFDVGRGIQLRVLSRPGLMVREENRNAPLEKTTHDFNATCVPIWEHL